VRRWFVVTSALNGTATVHVHVIYPYIPFEKHERLQLPYEVDMRSVALVWAAAIMKAWRRPFEPAATSPSSSVESH
jgi:hypothetical protein